MVFKKNWRKVAWSYPGLKSPGVFHRFSRKHKKCQPGFAIWDLRFAIRNFRISDFGVLVWLRPHRNFNAPKNWPRSCPFQVFEKPKILNQTIAFCYGFQKTDAKLRGAILGFDPISVFICFCKKRKHVCQGLSCLDLRFAILNFRISDFRVLVWLRPRRNFDTEKTDPDHARFRFSKNQRYSTKR